MTANSQFADRAPQAADRAGLDRRAWLCVAVILDTTTTAAAARKALDDIAEGELRDRAAVLLAGLLDGLPAGPGASRVG